MNSITRIATLPTDVIIRASRSDFINSYPYTYKISSNETTKRHEIFLWCEKNFTNNNLDEAWMCGTTDNGSSVIFGFRTDEDFTLFKLTWY